MDCWDWDSYRGPGGKTPKREAEFISELKQQLGIHKCAQPLKVTVQWSRGSRPSYASEAYLTDSEQWRWCHRYLLSTHCALQWPEQQGNTVWNKGLTQASWQLTKKPSQQCDLTVIEWSEEVAKLENSEVSEVHTVSRLSYQIHVQVLNWLPQLNCGHTHTNTCDKFF